MTTLLKIQSSLSGDAGESSRLATRYAEAWAAHHPHGRVLTRDLSRDPVPHLSAERFAAFFAAPEERTPAQRAIVDESETLIDELRAADVLVVAAPMHNFSVPSTLRAYFDHVARAGVTFQYTAEGPKGLLNGKKVYIFAARGGRYAGTPQDSQTTYVRDFLGFIGITDVEFIYAEGLNMGDESKATALAGAQKAVAELAA